MFRLFESQDIATNELAAVCIRALSQIPSALLVGASGVGKRTVARAAAMRVHMRFVEIPLNVGGQALRDRLVGNREEAAMAVVDGPAPGVLGQDGPVFIYLSNLQYAPQETHQALHQIVATRQYVDAAGRRWAIRPAVWLVASLVSPNGRDSKLGLEHWLPAAFESRINVPPPKEAGDIATILSSMSASCDCELEPDAASMQLVLSELHSTADCLHSLRRWVEAVAAVSKPHNKISAHDVAKAGTNDLLNVVAGVQYLGLALSRATIDSWLAQFPDEIRPLGFGTREKLPYFARQK